VGSMRVGGDLTLYMARSMGPGLIRFKPDGFFICVGMLRSRDFYYYKKGILERIKIYF
jgi:hypothetical protein